MPQILSDIAPQVHVPLVEVIPEPIRNPVTGKPGGAEQQHADDPRGVVPDPSEPLRWRLNPLLEHPAPLYTKASICQPRCSASRRCRAYGLTMIGCPAR